MKKKHIESVLFVLLCVVVMLDLSTIYVLGSDGGDVTINEENFPDEKFREYVKTEFDEDEDEVLSSEEISKITTVDVYKRNDIASLKGIEKFSNLTALDCTGTGISELDVSSNLKLESLICAETEIETLDLKRKNFQVLILTIYES